jgi:hypothetical protein
MDWRYFYPDTAENMGHLLGRLISRELDENSDSDDPTDSLVTHLNTEQTKLSLTSDYVDISAQPQIVRLWAPILSKRRKYFAESICLTDWTPEGYRVTMLAYLSTPMLPTYWYLTTRSDGPDGLVQQFRQFNPREMSIMTHSICHRDGDLHVALEDALTGSVRLLIRCPSLDIDVVAECQHGVYNEVRDLPNGTWKQTAYNHVTGFTGHMTLTQCDAPPNEVMDGCVLVRFRAALEDVALDLAIQMSTSQVSTIRGSLRVTGTAWHISQATHHNNAWPALHSGNCRNLDANVWVIAGNYTVELPMQVDANQLSVVDLMDPLPRSVRHMCRLLGKRRIIHTHVGSARLLLRGDGADRHVFGTFMHERHISI